MCGINGITARNSELVQRMNGAIAHRGPDGVGVFESDQVTFGHCRLAIIDTSPAGAQPRKNADGSVVLTYNGELYNYRELRRELADYSFVSETDTEVILAAYERWGMSCLSRFNGIFALALWDARVGKLFLVRDQLGIKPLYYAEQGGTVFFSSEIKGLLEAGIDRTLDRTSFSHFMRTSDVPGPGSLFSHIHKVPPGAYITVANGTITKTEYWHLDIETVERQTPEVWRQQIQNTFDRAVERQLISDRPVGMFLSGGIDSSAVLATMVRLEGAARTYTTRFEVDSPAEEAKFNRDADLARKTAAHFGTTHTEVLVRQRDLIGLLEDATWHLDEPSGSATALSQLAIAREASKDVAVVLGGDGGDELFGGYERYRLSRLMDLYGRTPSFVRDALRARGSYGKLDTPRGIDRFALFHFTKEHDLQSVLAREFQADYTTQYFKDRFFSNTDVPFLAALMDADRQTLADGSLLRTDKLSMAAGLEARVPILDLEMVQLAARIPADQKVGWFTTKKLFKEAMRDRLPSYLFSEPKRGWFAPSGTWLQQPDFHAYIQEVLSPSYYEETKDLFDWEGIRGVLKGHYEHTRYNRPLIWSLLSFQIWARSFQVTV